MPRIIDIHSHVWRFPEDFTQDFRDQAGERARADHRLDLTSTQEGYLSGVPEDEEFVRIVFGGKARRSGLWVDDSYVAQFVQQHPDNSLGFLSVDPTQPDWQAEMESGHQQLGMCGIKLLPMYAGFFPQDPIVDPLWEYATKHNLPVLLHTGTNFVSQAPLECTLPRNLDPVASKFPEVKIILAHVGHPYSGDCIVTVRKHRNLYTDISAIHYRPFQFYNTLVLVQEYGIWDKLLFGTDYPFTTIQATVDHLRNMNEMVAGTNLPRLDYDEIESMIYRDTLSLLELPDPHAARSE
ncbi:MAG: amidohydrolase family protein [Planctomycetota bacterium]|nr:amidohydrolase family protein [Planctomycetota bacterium]